MTARAPTMTGPYAQEEFLDDLYRVTGGETDKVLAELTIARSSELLGWMDEQGVRFQPPLGGTLCARQDQRLFPRRRARRAQRALPRARRRSASPCVYDSPVTALTIANGYFMSAAVKHEGQDAKPSAAARWSPPPAASRPISNG